jgi:hypothetical protein
MGIQVGIRVWCMGVPVVGILMHLLLVRVGVVGGIMVHLLMVGLSCMSAMVGVLPRLRHKGHK